MEHETVQQIPPKKRLKIMHFEEEKVEPIEVIEEQKSNDPTYCYCRAVYSEDDSRPMIACEGGCNGWFHLNCLGLGEAQIKNLDAFYCPECQYGGPLATTIKTKGDLLNFLSKPRPLYVFSLAMGELEKMENAKVMEERGLLLFPEHCRKFMARLPLLKQNLQGKTKGEKIRFIAKWAHSQKGVRACGKPDNATLWNFVSGGDVNCLGMATAVLAVCELLRIPNVFSVFSETHVWIAYLDSDQGQLTEIPSINDPDLHFIETNDIHFAGDDVKAERKETWMYQGFKGATVCDTNLHARFLLASLKLDDPHLHLEMITRILESSKRPIPRELIEIGDCFWELDQRDKAVEFYTKAVEVAKANLGDTHVLPYIWRADAFREANKYDMVLEDCFSAMRVVAQYKYAKEDEDLLNLILEEVLKTAVDLCCDKGALQTDKFINFMDHSMRWFEKWTQLKSSVSLAKLLTRIAKNQTAIFHLQASLAQGQIHSTMLKTIGSISEKTKFTANKMADLMSGAWPK
jgi:tetratricopeptide (TPR) repeat protein